MSSLPTHAIIAVTLNCNSHCVMCDIWKNKISHELQPAEYLKLPSSLIDINITGGEPFLRQDLPQIIKNIKTACPKSRLILNTNGFLPHIIKKNINLLLHLDPNFAFRVSIDGWQKTHDQIRGIPGGFDKCLQSLNILKNAGVKDLGISFTIMENNYRELPLIQQYCKKNNLDLSLTLVSDSPIYFGQKKSTLRPKNKNNLKKYIFPVIKSHLLSIKPKNWLRAWFEYHLYQYSTTHHRPLSCQAGRNFFYLDSIGNIFACHLKNWKIGNLINNSFSDLWQSSIRQQHCSKSAKCHDCWMICSAKPSIDKIFS